MVLAVLAPALPDGLPRVSAFIVLAVLLVAVPLLIHRQTGERKAPAGDRDAQRTRTGILTGSLTGLTVGVTALAFVPLVRDLAGVGHDPATGNPAVQSEGQAGRRALSEDWRAVVAHAEELLPGSSQHLLRVDLNDRSGDRTVTFNYVDASGAVHTASRYDGDWDEPRRIDIAASYRDTFDAGAVSADLDDLVAAVKQEAVPVKPDLTFLELTVSKADPETVIDTPDGGGVVGDSGRALVSVGLIEDPDDIIADHTVQATGDGAVSPVTAHGDVAGEFIRAVGAFAAAGVDTASAALDELDIDHKSFPGGMRFSAVTPDDVRTGLSWDSGEFPVRTLGGYNGLFASDPPWRDLDAGILANIVEDARSRGNLMDNERGRVSLKFDTTTDDTPVIIVTVSDDPGARGVYDLRGTWLRADR